ncbi:hypothetical protein GBA52_005019 [Prunus armeniaca]|nr:hypothetical protein GBA52_005019 [Prunus armeniaca]
MEMNSTSKPPSPAMFFFLGGIVMLIILLVLIFVFRKLIKPEELKKLVARARRQPESKDLFSGNLRTISYFDFRTLKIATKNFHPGNLLGVGGFGPVYRVLLLNLWQPMVLVFFYFSFYIFFPNLQKNTVMYHKNHNHEKVLYASTAHYYRNWFSSFTAAGYSYFHKHAAIGFVISHNYRAKDKQIKEKLLALQSFMSSKAWKLFETSNVIELVDPKLLENGFVERDVLQAIQVAFLCLQPHAKLRPPMSEVVAMLTCKVEMIGTPMKPAFLERRHTKDQNLSWDTISEVFPSPFQSESTSLPKPPT